METRGEDIDSADKQKEIPGSSRPSAASSRNLSRKFILICVCIFALALCICVATLAFGNFGSSKNGDEPDIATNANTATATMNSDSEPGTDESNSDEELQPVEVPPTDAALINDPRLKDSDSDNKQKPKNRVVYLTFDDGPSDLTPSILKTLKKNDVKATWFVTGLHINLDHVKDIWDSGHQLALHSNSHKYKKIYKSKDAFFNDMDIIAKKIHDRTGVAPKLIRFPGGSINSYNKKTYKSIMKEMDNRNWHYFDWNASVDDAVSSKKDSVKKIVANAKKSSKGKHSICLLMHDTNAEKATAKALDKIIKYYKKKGYKFDYLTADSYGYHF